MSEFYQDDETLGKVPMYRPFQRIREVKKSRVDSSCEICGNKIPKGSRCQYWSQGEFGQFTYFRVCEDCIREGEELFNGN